MDENKDMCDVCKKQFETSRPCKIIIELPTLDGAKKQTYVVCHDCMWRVKTLVLDVQELE